jgi:hypothetical protein
MGCVWWSGRDNEFSPLRRSSLLSRFGILECMSASWCLDCFFVVRIWGDRLKGVYRQGIEELMSNNERRFVFRY